MEIEKIEKIEQKYYCEKCDYMCRYLSDWKKHINTDKHFGNKMEIEEIKQIEYKKDQANFICKCGKKYKANSGLWKHQKKCIVFASSQNEIINIESSHNDNANTTNTAMQTSDFTNLTSQ